MVQAMPTPFRPHVEHCASGVSAPRGTGRWHGLLCVGLGLALSGCTLPAFRSAPSIEIGTGAVGVERGGIAGDALARLPVEDRERALAAEFRALEFGAVGRPVMWRGRRGSGSVSALAPFSVGSQDCRQLTHDFTIDGASGQARGSACRNRNGSWTPLT